MCPLGGGQQPAFLVSPALAVLADAEDVQQRLRGLRAAGRDGLATAAATATPAAGGGVRARAAEAVDDPFEVRRYTAVDFERYRFGFEVAFAEHHASERRVFELDVDLRSVELGLSAAAKEA